MNRKRVQEFIQLSGQGVPERFTPRTARVRTLGAQLLLSEVLEYVIKGLGVVPQVNGVAIRDPESLRYYASEEQPDQLEMLDGLADVAYTMFWNAIAFGLPLESAYEAVCENNLEKFVRLEKWRGDPGALAQSEWHCGINVEWPEEVHAVEVICLGSGFFAVGKDSCGKVRKPCHYQAVDLKPLLES